MILRKSALSFCTTSNIKSSTARLLYSFHGNNAAPDDFASSLCQLGQRERMTATAETDISSNIRNLRGGEASENLAWIWYESFALAHRECSYWEVSW